MPTTTQPTTTPIGRIVALDVARGVAILGTLATNIWIFSHPAGMLGYLDHPTSAGAPSWQQAVEAVLQQLANGKFLGLLTLMFGIGLAIQAESAERRGQAWPGPYLWRAVILFVDGVLHYLLVVEFDVLMGYAVTGAVVAYVIACSERVRRIWFAAAAGVHVCLVAILTLGMWLGGPVTRAPFDNPYRTGTWWDLVLLRLDAAALFRFEPVFLLFLGTAMFLLGRRLYVAGVLHPQGTHLRRRLMGVGAIALPVDLVLGLGDPAWLFVTRYGTAPLVAVGLLALIVELAGRAPTPSWAGRRLSEVGRVALSAYVLQNLVASVLFYGWGFDLGGLPDTVRLPVTIAGWGAVSALVFTAAHLWLRRFARGPLEWVWNAAYRRLARDA